MSSAASDLVNKVWNDCNLLRDDGVSYGDYVEQLTYLLIPQDGLRARRDLDDFVRCYNPANRHQRKKRSESAASPTTTSSSAIRPISISSGSGTNSLGDSSDLPDPAVLAAEIVEDLQAALDQFAQIAADLGAVERDTGSG